MPGKPQRSDGSDDSNLELTIKTIQRKCRGCNEKKPLSLRYCGMVPHGLFCDPCWSVRHERLALKRTLLRIA